MIPHLSRECYSQSKDDDGSPQQTGAIPEGYLGLAAFRGELCHETMSGATMKLLLNQSMV
jgi:hypothetical protein